MRYISLVKQKNFSNTLIFHKWNTVICIHTNLRRNIIKFNKKIFITEYIWRTTGIQNQFFTFRTMRTKKEKNSKLNQVRPILNLLIQFWLLKTFRLIVSKLLASRELFNCTKLFHMPALVAAETFTREFPRIIWRNKQRCLWLSVTRFTAFFQILRVRKIFESLFQIRKRSGSFWKIVHRLKILIAIRQTVQNNGN